MRGGGSGDDDGGGMGLKLHCVGRCGELRFVVVWREAALVLKRRISG